MAEVAVIIPARLDRAEAVGWLKEAVDSVCLQTFQAWELVIVDDAGLLPVPDEFRSRAQVLRHDRPRGPGAARNVGVRATSASWIIGLDADDRLKPDALASLYAHRCETGIVYGDTERFGMRNGIQRLFDWNLNELRKLSGPVGVTALFHRKAWQLVGGWREDLEGLEDIDLWIRLTEQGICGIHLDLITLEYRHHEESRTARLWREQRITGIANRIREAHASFLNGGIMACSDCPGGAVPNSAASQPPEAGMIPIRYIGPALASFRTPQSPITHREYRVGGRGAELYVDPRDVDWLMMFRRGGAPEFEAMTPPAPPPQTREVLEALAVADPVPDITILNVRDAVTTIGQMHDILDLRVMLVQENATEEPRKTVIKAIEKRIGELGG